MASGGEEKKSRILVVGGTGYIGRHIVAASARMGHPTTALLRDLAPFDQAKARLLQSFRDAGVTLLQGDLYDHASLLRAVRHADVVISAVRAPQVPDQTNLIAAIKEGGAHVRRFIPSEFGLDPGRSATAAVEPARSIYGSKVGIRGAVEAAGIPHTYVACNYFAGFALPSIGQFMPKAAPVDSVVILGDGGTKVVFVEEGDIGTYTVLAAVDPRAENKTVHIRPPANTMSHDELVSMWEKKSGKKLERVYVPEDAVLSQIKELAYPMDILVSIAHAAYCRGEMTSPLDHPQDVEATLLYPHIQYTTVDEYLNTLL
uniref:NmrA-like domain-containing protein n=1 Tax=Oryza punctata TaxID=4537 RepID=A0A0E0JD50_ORYPU